MNLGFLNRKQKPKTDNPDQKKVEQNYDLDDPEVREFHRDMAKFQQRYAAVAMGEACTLGYLLDLDVNNLSAGNRKLTLTELSNEGDAKSISVKVSLPGGNKGAAKPTAKPKAKSKSQGTSPGEERKLMRDLLKHHDEAFIFHRQKSAEHAAFVDYHSKMRGDAKHRVLALLNKKALEHHDGLRAIYRKIGDQAYSMLKPKDKDAKGKDTTKNEKKKPEKGSEKKKK